MRMLTVSDRSHDRLETLYEANCAIAVNMMPLFHVGGIVRNLLAPIMSGGSAIMCAGFDATSFWPLAMEIGATWCVFLPIGIIVP
jgi:acyl-CoA synthetase (AMP-forming)/AMP-acid ligase II